jgi:hypothetical protein
MKSAPLMTAVPIVVQKATYHPRRSTARGILRACGSLLAVFACSIVALALFDMVALDTDENGTTTVNMAWQRWFPFLMGGILAANSLSMFVLVDSFGNFRQIRRARALLPFALTHMEQQSTWAL